MNTADQQAFVTRVGSMTLDAIHQEIALEVVAAHAAMERRDALAQLAVRMADHGIDSAAKMTPELITAILRDDRRWF